MNEKNNLTKCSEEVDIDVKTGRKYWKEQKLPSELAKPHNWKTRENPFDSIWPEVEELLINNPGLQAKTIFEFLQSSYPGKFQDGQLRSLQRRIKHWRATKGPGKEIIFPQKHYAGDRSQSDFTSMNDLNITINHVPFEHLLYHFILTYSNWEFGNICYSESFANLIEGLEKCLWCLGGIPLRHQTDNLSAAVKNNDPDKNFTQNYLDTCKYYNIKPEKTNPESPNENGDIEQSHYRFKTAVDQQLMLRGSRNFTSIKEYEKFLIKVFEQRNSARQVRLKEELKVLRPLPRNKINYCETNQIKVGPSSTIRIKNKVYSVPSRLRGETLKVNIYSKSIELRYGQTLIEKIERLEGSKKHSINYRHIIKSLLKKPGAFENYKYKSDLFPSVYFRIAYDQLREQNSGYNKEYLLILNLAAEESEELTEQALVYHIEESLPINFATVNSLVLQKFNYDIEKQVEIEDVNLQDYDELLTLGVLNEQ